MPSEHLLYLIFGCDIPHWFIVSQYLMKQTKKLERSIFLLHYFLLFFRRGYKRRNGMFSQGRRVKMVFTLRKDASKRNGKWNDNKTLWFSAAKTQLPTEPFTHLHTGSFVLTDLLFSSNQAAVAAAEPERTLGNQAFKGLFPLHYSIILCHKQLILTFHPRTKLSHRSQMFITVHTHTQVRMTSDVADNYYTKLI